MSTRFNIDYNGWSDEASPIKDDVKIKTSHNRLVAQAQNAKARGEWGRKNPDKQKKLSVKGGECSKSEIRRKISSDIGKKYGAENAVKFIPIETKIRNGKKYGKLNLVGDIVCESCGRKTNKGNYSQFHGKKCREKDIINFIQLLPDKFTKGIARDIAKENRIKGWEKWNIFHDLCPYTKCIVKVDKPNQYNPCWYGKNKREINKTIRRLK